MDGNTKVVYRQEETRAFVTHQNLFLLCKN